MKKSFRIILLLCISAIIAFSLLSCSGEDEPCSHAWDEGNIKVEPTCKKEGEVLFTCTLCGEEKTEAIKGEHTYEKDICTLCGAFNDKVKNPNLLLIDSIFSEKGFTLTGKNISFKLKKN